MMVFLVSNEWQGRRGTSEYGLGENIGFEITQAGNPCHFRYTGLSSESKLVIKATAKVKDLKGRPGKPSGRERLLATARDLLVRHGAANVGINDVTDAAGVAKMTLYNNFSSKEALTVAVYEELAETTLGELRKLSAQQSEEKRIFAVIDYLDDRALGAEYRGCPFIHASVQAAEPTGPIYVLVQSYKRAFRDLVLGLLDEQRANRADLADQLVILLDGAVTETYLKGVANPGASAKRAVTTLLQSAAEPPKKP